MWQQARHQRSPSPGGSAFPVSPARQPEHPVAFALLLGRSSLIMVKATLLPKIPVEESAQDDKRRERAHPFLAMMTENREKPVHSQQLSTRCSSCKAILCTEVRGRDCFPPAAFWELGRGPCCGGVLTSRPPGAQTLRQWPRGLTSERDHYSLTAIYDMVQRWSDRASWPSSLA
jgi:hypothetical protein